MRTKVTVTQARNPVEPKVVVRECSPQELIEELIAELRDMFGDDFELLEDPTEISIGDTSIWSYNETLAEAVLDVALQVGIIATSYSLFKEHGSMYVRSPWAQEDSEEPDFVIRMYNERGRLVSYIRHVTEDFREEFLAEMPAYAECRVEFYRGLYKRETVYRAQHGVWVREEAE